MQSGRVGRACVLAEWPRGRRCALARSFRSTTQKCSGEGTRAEGDYGGRLLVLGGPQTSEAYGRARGAEAEPGARAG